MFFMRPAKEKTIPADLFWWEGPDGTRVLTYRIPISYTDRGSVRARIEQVITQFKDQLWQLICRITGQEIMAEVPQRRNFFGQGNQAEAAAPFPYIQHTWKIFQRVRSIDGLDLRSLKMIFSITAVGCTLLRLRSKKAKGFQRQLLLLREDRCTARSSGTINIQKMILLQHGKGYYSFRFTTAWRGRLFLNIPQTAREGYGYAWLLHISNIHCSPETGMADCLWRSCFTIIFGL